MQIEDNLTLISSILKNGDTILIPFDGIWGLSCDARDENAVNRINDHIESHDQTFKEIIVADIPMLKKYVPRLHPRVETLLYYHRRPIRVRCSQNVLPQKKQYMRIVKDAVSRVLLHELDFPLYFVSFFENDIYHPSTLDQINTQKHRRIRFVANQNLNIAYEPNPLLCVEFDDEGSIKVLK